MSKLRSVNTHFWDDNYIIDLDPIEKLLFLYLLTNPQTNMLGIFELHVRKIAFDTGIDKEMVIKIFDRFKIAGKASYIDGYVCLHNFTKHQSYNTNMKISAINVFNELPVVVRKQGFIVNTLNGLKPFPKGSEPIAEIEYEYEYEIEYESEGEEAKMKGADAPAHKPDSLEEVILFFENNGGNDTMAFEFFHTYESQKWVKKNGMAITSWKSAAALWIKREIHDTPAWKKSKTANRSELPFP